MINYETCERQAGLCSFIPSTGKNVVKMFHNMAQIVNMHMCAYIKCVHMYSLHILYKCIENVKLNIVFNN